MKCSAIISRISTQKTFTTHLLELVHFAVAGIILIIIIITIVIIIIENSFFSRAEATLPREKKHSCSMTIGNVEYLQECSVQHLSMEQQE